ncbi:MAG: TonB-dependent receptor [Pseudomonadota bacterium]|nr:TonB-dependent receptor [Pseudomonadota bacterium]
MNPVKTRLAEALPFAGHRLAARYHHGQCRAALAVLAALAAAGLGSNSYAIDHAPARTPTLEEIMVIGTTPVPGLHIDIDKVPGNVQSVLAGDLTQYGPASLAGALNGHLGSVSISDNLADPFQPNVLYRGFAASPVLGTPQGLAVYQNGVRVNEAFGDSVNWDLIPDMAISRVDILSSSPLYGLNALGGAMAVAMKNGFSYQGIHAEASGGSFNQRTGASEFGANKGPFAVYAAIRALDQDGWRLFAHDSLRQYYVDFSLHATETTVDLSYSRANNRLYGPGAAPVQSLALDPRAVFTGPQANLDDLDFMTLNASYAPAGGLALQGVGYFRNYRQSVSNGNGSNFVACTSPAYAAALCQADAVTPLTDASGAVLPDISDGGTNLVGQNNFESIHSQTWGGSIQFTDGRPVGRHDNQFALGATVDAGHTNFLSGTQVGLIDASLIVESSTLFVDTPEGSAFAATPVILDADTKYYGFYATDTMDVTSALAVTASGRFNVAKVDLSDRRGNNLDGRNRFTHFNPALGATYKLSRGLTAFLGFALNNRAPTASEIECSDPLQPCLLPSSLAGDPPNLKQVIAHAFEAGLRGRSDGGRLSWNASAFRTNLNDDIYGVATSVSTGFFRNIGFTRRQGIELGLDYRSHAWSAYGQYGHVDATFGSPLTLYSPSNPFADANGDIHVPRGALLPGIPRNRLKVGVDYAVSPRWSVGTSILRVSDQFYHGDEANRNPPLPGYTAVSLRSSYQASKQLEIFANVQNLFAARYATYGLFGDPTGVNAPGIPNSATANDPGVDTRFQNPAAPRSVFGGVRLIF